MSLLLSMQIDWSSAVGKKMDLPPDILKRQEKTIFIIAPPKIDI